MAAGGLTGGSESAVGVRLRRLSPPAAEPRLAGDSGVIQAESWSRSWPLARAPSDSESPSHVPAASAIPGPTARVIVVTAFAILAVLQASTAAAAAAAGMQVGLQRVMTQNMENKACQ